MDNALPLIQGWIKSSKYKVIILPRINREFDCEDVLGITDHSVLGSIINGVGGISISNNLIRHFGGENKFGLSVRCVNQVQDKRPTLIDGQLIIADDIYGGLYSINSDPIIGTMGNVFYLPPDSYVWENLEVGHSMFVKWTLLGDLDLFYRTIRDKLPSLTNTCDLSECFSFTPPLWVKASGYSCSKYKSIENIKIRSQMVSQIYNHE